LLVTPLQSFVGAHQSVVDFQIREISLRLPDKATINVHAASRSRLFRKEGTGTDPEFCEGFEIFLVSAGDCVFLPTLDAGTASANVQPLRISQYSPFRYLPSRLSGDGICGARSANSQLSLVNQSLIQPCGVVSGLPRVEGARGLRRLRAKNSRSCGGVPTL
jgi:hypothetical protein